MIKEKQILEIVGNNDVITTEELTKNKIHRVYLTKLLKENKIQKVDRGIYAINNKVVNDYYIMQVKSKKIIFSHFTALEIQGFYKNIDKCIHISVQQGYNGKKFNKHKVFYNNKEIYELGLIQYNYNGFILKVYDIERSVCDIIKNQNRFTNDDYNKFINYYFNSQNLNYKKLLQYSTKLKIDDKVYHYLTLFKA